MLLIFGHLAAAQTVAREPVEEVVAVVGRTPILRSDVEVPFGAAVSIEVIASILGLLEQRPGQTDAQYRSALLDARIRLEVQYRDLESSGILYRLDLDVAGVRQSLVEGAGGDAVLDPRLAYAGLGATDLDELALRMCAANAYAEQRLRPRINVSLQEIESAYQRLAVDLESQGEIAPPLTAVNDRLHRIIAERKLNDEIERWLERAMDELEVTRFVR